MRTLSLVGHKHMVAWGACGILSAGCLVTSFNSLHQACCTFRNNLQKAWKQYSLK